MAKKVKLPLDMGNDVFVRTLDELKENYNSEKAVESFLDGRLLTWLDDRYYEDEAARVRELSEQGDKDKLAVKLGEIFGVKVETEVDVDVLKIRREKLEKLRKITSDDNILANADSAAFSQEELDDLLDEDAKVIYLCSGSFRIPMSVKNIRYIGVANPVVSIGGNGEIDLEANGISFEDCEFAADTRGRIKANAGSKTAKRLQDENIDFTDDKYFKLEKTGGRILLKKYTGNHKIVKIPNIVNEIGDSAFYSGSNTVNFYSGSDTVNYEDDKKIRGTISAGMLLFGLTGALAGIGVNPYNEASKPAISKSNNTNSDLVEEIIIPNTVCSIAKYAFAERKNLKRINLPNGITSISEGIFINCLNLENIIIPSKVEIIGHHAFCGCISLKHITLPWWLKRIEYDTFCDCQSLEEIEIPDGVTHIEFNAFKGCINLKKVYLPKSLISLRAPSVQMPKNDYECRNDNQRRLFYEYKTAKGVFDDCPNVVVEYNGQTYRHGQLKSLYLQFQ